MIIKLELSSLSLFLSLLFFLLQRENLFIFIPLFVSVFLHSMISLSIILCSCIRFYLFSLFSLHPFFSTVLKPFLCSKCNTNLFHNSPVLLLLLFLSTKLLVLPTHVPQPQQGVGIPNQHPLLLILNDQTNRPCTASLLGHPCQLRKN